VRSSIEDHKRIEVAHYEAQARRWLAARGEDKWEADAHRFRHNALSSYDRFEELIRLHCAGRRVLDFGCGNGIHSLSPIRAGAREVVGIDLSEESIGIARRRAELAGLADRVTFRTMDCERLDFPDGRFDVAIDGGTFSSLDLGRALAELSRVLSPEGRVIGIETLGHNPLFNLKRRINVLRGTRTRWAADHIFKMDDFRLARAHFRDVAARFFHLSSLLVLPFHAVPGATAISRALDRLDGRLLAIPGLRRHAFKTVFVLSRPAGASCGGGAEVDSRRGRKEV
jgi:ubiquinone/menaquinone biosynthesis C-methylase UbiE